VGLALEKILHQLADQRDTGRATDQHDFVDLGWSQSCVFERLL
jgi:hypothetical protein